MESIEHAFYGTLAYLGFFIGGGHNLVSLEEGLFLLILSISVSVLIDLDHFFIEAVKTGSFEKFFLALRHPIRTVTDCKHLELTLSEKERLTSHFIILLLLIFIFTPIQLIFEKTILIVSSSVIYLSIGIHIICDIFRDAEFL